MAQDNTEAIATINTDLSSAYLHLDHLHKSILSELDNLRSSIRQLSPTNTFEIGDPVYSITNPHKNARGRVIRITSQFIFIQPDNTSVQIFKKRIANIRPACIPTRTHPPSPPSPHSTPEPISTNDNTTATRKSETSSTKTSKSTQHTHTRHRRKSTSSSKTRRTRRKTSVTSTSSSTQYESNLKSPSQTPSPTKRAKITTQHKPSSADSIHEQSPHSPTTYDIQPNSAHYQSTSDTREVSITLVKNLSTNSRRFFC